MAEINIEKKNNKKSIWPWIVGLLLLVGIIWVIAEVADSPDEEVAEQETIVAPVEDQDETNVISDNADMSTNMAGSDDFVSFVDDESVKEKMGMDHETTSQGLMKLSTALREISGGDEFEQEISQIEQNATEIKDDPESLKHADKISAAFTNAASVMQQIQSNKFPDAQSDVKEVQDVATKIQEDQQLLNQKENVRTFFEEAAEAVETMKSGMSS